MKTNDEIIMEIYRRLFKRAEPSANIDKIIKTGEGKKPNFFMKYYLSEKVQDKIIKEVLDKNKIKNKYKIQQFFTTILLGSAPNSSLENWKKIKNDISI